MILHTEVLQSRPAESILKSNYGLFNRNNIHIRYCCLLYTSDAADEGLGVGLVGRCIIKKKDAWYCESIVSD